MLVCVCGVRRRGWEGGGGQLLSRVRAHADMGFRGAIPFGLASLGCVRWGRTLTVKTCNVTVCFSIFLSFFL